MCGSHFTFNAGGLPDSVKAAFNCKQEENKVIMATMVLVPFADK
jgi:hypothetical protein